MPYPIDLF